jgi:hypothetical protein
MLGLNIDLIEKLIFDQKRLLEVYNYSNNL